MLETLNLTVWWDRELNAGDSFEDAIDKAILKSSCVVVVWSRHSIESQWVRNEALEGMERQILVPVLIDDVRVPVAFKQLQSINFLDWPNRYDETEYNDLVQAIEGKLSGVKLEAVPPDQFLTPQNSPLPLVSIIGLLILVVIGYFYMAGLEPEPSIMPESEVTTQHPLANDPVTYRKFLQAEDRIRRGEHDDIDEAIRLLTEVTKSAPRFAAGYTALCQSLLNSYDESNDAAEHQLAEKACNRALFLDQENAAVYVALGELFDTSGENDRSEESYLKAVGINEHEVDAYIGLGFLYMKQGRVVDAESAFKTATVKEPDYVKAQLSLGAFYFQQALFYQAGETFSTVTKIAPENASAWNNLGVSKMLAGEFDAAINAWTTANQLNKTSAAESNMAYVLYLTEKYPEAVVLVENAIQATPQDHRLWGNLGDILRFIPDRSEDMQAAYRQAIDLAEENRKIDPDDGYLLGRLSVYYAAMNETAKAQALIELAKKQAQNDIYILFDIAVALSILGEEQAATEQLEEAKAAGYPTALSDADPQFK